MYNVTIRTTIPALKEIHVKVENIDSPELKEVLEQPYIDKTSEIRIEKIKELTLHK